MSSEVSKYSDKEEDIDVKEIVKDIEEGEIGLNEILVKHKITLYKYNQILKIAELKKTYVRSKKVTKFKKMIMQSDVNVEDNSFNIEGFIGDCKSGMKISELMEKYKLSLYQVRELRKKFDLKTK
jgi:hypothetical protein